SFRILIVTGLASLVYSHLLYRTVWKQMNAVTVKDVEYPQHVEVGAEFVVKVKVHNSGKSIAKVIAIHLHFSGSSEPNQIGMIHNLRGAETREMEFRFRADQNMGPHYLGPIHTTIADYLGAHELTVRKNLQVPVILRPPILPVAFLETKRANYGMMPGVLDIPVSGSSPTFLGLRPWRDGDSIRQIDWKRSMRSQHIVVKEFERQSSTDVTLLLDTYQVAHSAFAKESSIEMAKTITISIANTLLQRQMRVQALIGDVWLPLGVGNHQLDTIYQYPVEAKLGRDPIHAMLKEH